MIKYLARLKRHSSPEAAVVLFTTFQLNGRGGEIRTPDPLFPKQMRYQAALRPDKRFSKHSELI